MFSLTISISYDRAKRSVKTAVIPARAKERARKRIFLELKISEASLPANRHRKGKTGRINLSWRNLAMLKKANIRMMQKMVNISGFPCFFKANIIPADATNNKGAPIP